MRHWILIVLMAGVLQVNAQGIRFVEGSFQEVLSQAQKDKKLVFIDGYTTWCAPCRKMDENVYPSAVAGKFFNEHFVSAKFDMEKGQGKILAVKYGIKAYPTLLFLDSEGTLIHKVAGYQTPVNLVKEARKALNPEMSLAAMEKRFANGDRSPDFLIKYMNARYKLGDNSHGPIAEAYLKTQKDWSNPKTMEVIYQYTIDADSDMFAYLIAHKDEFYRRFGAGKVGRKIQRILERKLNAKNTTLEEMQALYRKIYPGSQGEEMASKIRLAFYRRRGDRDGYAKAAFDHLKKYPVTDAYEMNAIAETFYSAIHKKRYLRKMARTLKKYLKYNPDVENYLTLAHLYIKMKRKRKARKAAMSAMVLAKAQDDELGLDDAKTVMEEIKAM